MYRYYNANPMLNDIEDCTIRALSVAEDISWDEAYKKLSDYARKKGLMLSSVKSVENYLDDHYYRECNYDITVGEFIEEHPVGTYLITMDGHIMLQVSILTGFKIVVLRTYTSFQVFEKKKCL